MGQSRGEEDQWGSPRGEDKLVGGGSLAQQTCVQCQNNVSIILLCWFFGQRKNLDTAPV